MRRILGRNSDICGINITPKVIKRTTKKKYLPCLHHSETDTFKSRQTNRVCTPTGGVRLANNIIILKEMPKWVGSIPIARAAGNMSGKNISIMGTASIKNPIRKNIKKLTIIN